MNNTEHLLLNTVSTIAFSPTNFPPHWLRLLLIGMARSKERCAELSGVTNGRNELEGVNWRKGIHTEWIDGDYSEAERFI